MSTILLLALALAGASSSREPSAAPDGGALFDEAWSQALAALGDEQRRLLEESVLPLEAERDRARAEARERHRLTLLDGAEPSLLRRSARAAADRSVGRVLLAAELARLAGPLEALPEASGARLRLEALRALGWQAGGPAEVGLGSLVAVHESGALLSIRSVEARPLLRRRLVEQAIRIGGELRGCESAALGELCLQRDGWTAFTRNGLLVEIQGSRSLAASIDELIWEALSGGVGTGLWLVGARLPCRPDTRRPATAVELGLKDVEERDRSPRGPTLPELALEWERALEARPRSERLALLAPFALAATPPHESPASARKREMARRAGRLSDTPEEVIFRKVASEARRRLSEDERLLQSGLPLIGWEQWRRSVDSLFLPGELFDRLRLELDSAGDGPRTAARWKGRDSDCRVSVGNGTVHRGWVLELARFGPGGGRLSGPARPCPNGIGEACLHGRQESTDRSLIHLRRGSAVARITAEPAQAWEAAAWFDLAFDLAARGEAFPELPTIAPCRPESAEAGSEGESALRRLLRGLEERDGWRD